MLLSRSWHFIIFTFLLSRCSRQRERLSATMLSICSSVRLSVRLFESVAKMQKTRFSQKLTTIQSYSLYWRPIGSHTWAFQRTHYWTPKIQDGWDPPSCKSTWRRFFLLKVDKISQTGAEWHVDCGDMVKIETKCRIPIWRTLRRFPWHVIPEPHATLQGVIIPSAILKVVFRHILLFFLF